MDKFTEVITYFAIMSVAAERLTDIFKKAWLAKREVNPAVYQVISGLFGAGLAYTAPLVIPSVNDAGDWSGRLWWFKFLEHDP